MSDYLRVRDKDTGHEYTIRAEHLNAEAHEVLDKPALDNHGEPAAMKPRQPLGKRARGRRTAKKAAPKKAASSGTKNPAPATASEQEDNGRQADSEQENS